MTHRSAIQFRKAISLSSRRAAVLHYPLDGRTPWQESYAQLRMSFGDCGMTLA